MPSLSEKRINNHLHSISHHQTDNTNTKLQSLIDIQNRVTNQIKIGTAAATAIVADAEPGIADENERPGWLFRKIASGTEKINWYFYGQGNKQLTLGSLKNIIATISIDNYQGTSSQPFFSVYTVATGVGDVSWYKSKITYTMKSTETLILGESINIWTHEEPTTTNSLRSVPFNTKSVEGTGLDDEILMTIAFSSDSAAPALTQILVEELGFSMTTTSNDIMNHKIKLIA